MRRNHSKPPGVSRRSIVGALCAAVLTANAMTGTAQAGPTTGALFGRVTLDGQGVAGAMITLTVMTMETSDVPYREEPIATATSNAAGVFTLPLEVTQDVLHAAQTNNGYVNYALRAVLGEVAMDSSEPYKLLGVPGMAYTAADFVYTRLMAAGGEGAEDAVTDVTSYVLATPDLVSLEMSAVGTLGTATEPGGKIDRDCNARYAPYITAVAWERPFQPVGEAHVGWDMSAVFEYGTHANTDLGGAFSFGGGPYKASTGTNHMGNKSMLIRKYYDENQKYKLLSSFEYVKERLDFTDDDGDGRICRTDHRIRPIAWRGGYTFGEDVSRYDSHGQMDAARGKGWAVYYRGHGEFHKKHGQTKKYHNGVEAFGVGVTSQSSWSKQVDLLYTLTEKTDAWFYGSNGPIDVAGAVYVW